MHQAGEMMQGHISHIELMGQDNEPQTVFYGVKRQAEATEA
jgi:hypothetical protein